MAVFYDNTASIDSCTFANNTATDDGGALLVSSSIAFSDLAEPSDLTLSCCLPSILGE